MPRVNLFEDLFAWQKARELARLVTRTTATRAFGQDLRLRGQFRSAAASVMSNIAEGFDRGRRTEFHQFLSIAKGSAAEVRSLVHFCYDAGLLGREVYLDLLRLSHEVGKLVAGLRKSVDPRRKAGSPES